MSTHGLVKDTTLKPPSEEDMHRIAQVIKQPVDMVYVAIAGRCVKYFKESRAVNERILLQLLYSG